MPTKKLDLMMEQPAIVQRADEDDERRAGEDAEDLGEGLAAEGNEHSQQQRRNKWRVRRGRNRLEMDFARTRTRSTMPTRRANTRTGRTSPKEATIAVVNASKVAIIGASSLAYLSVSMWFSVALT